MPRLALIQFLDGSDGPVDPNFGVGAPPARPDNSLPDPGQGGAITLPVYPFDPTAPDNTLPTPTPPPTIWPPRPGMRFKVKWLACKGLVLVPDNSLPTAPPPTAGNTLPETGEPK